MSFFGRLCSCIPYHIVRFLRRFVVIIVYSRHTLRRILLSTAHSLVIGTLSAVARILFSDAISNKHVGCQDGSVCFGHDHFWDIDHSICAEWGWDDGFLLFRELMT